MCYLLNAHVKFLSSCDWYVLLLTFGYVNRIKRKEYVRFAWDVLLLTFWYVKRIKGKEYVRFAWDLFHKGQPFYNFKDLSEQARSRWPEKNLSLLCGDCLNDNVIWHNLFCEQNKLKTGLRFKHQNVCYGLWEKVHNVGLLFILHVHLSTKQ